MQRCDSEWDLRPLLRSLSVVLLCRADHHFDDEHADKKYDQRSRWRKPHKKIHVDSPGEHHEYDGDDDYHENHEHDESDERDENHEHDEHDRPAALFLPCAN